ETPCAPPKTSSADLVLSCPESSPTMLQFPVSTPSFLSFFPSAYAAAGNCGFTTSAREPLTTLPLGRSCTATTFSRFRCRRPGRRTLPFLRNHFAHSLLKNGQSSIDERGHPLIHLRQLTCRFFQGFKQGEHGTLRMHARNRTHLLRRPFLTELSSQSTSNPRHRVAALLARYVRWGRWGTTEIGC